mmetsp:Transcript_11273/g.27521  ORF Transcript_11273/g.27521 Transcript_11273/m.27521 type:complete len:608 (-) Transcript_11273:1875-3698(-)
MADAEIADTPRRELASNLTLDILQTVKTSQSQHGLRHGDHVRYRQYCTRRLARLYKALKFGHGRGRYQKKALEAATVTDERHLLIPLMAAERAWSYAMELKRDAGDEPPKRAHMIRRLKKATIHAAELVSLCSQVGSARTALEAEAYSSYMFGSFLTEQEQDWDRALAKFQRARKAFEQLARVGGPDQAELCRERLEELEPNLRYCTYKRGSGDGGGSAGVMDEEDLAALKGEGAADDERLKAVLAEESERTLDTFAVTVWRGHEIPIRNRAARACIANAVTQLAKLESPLLMSAERGLGIFDKAFMAYNDARQHLRDELAVVSSARGGESDSTSRLAEIKLADRALAVVLSERTIERNKFLVSSANAKLLGEIKLEKGEKATRPEDLVHLFNTLLHNYEELAESGPEVLRGVAGAEGLEEQIRMDCMLEQALLQAQRAAALAKVHLSAGSHVEAAVLFARAAEHAARVQNHVSGSPEFAAAAGRIQVEARKSRCLAVADGTAALVARQKGLRTGFASVSLQEGPASGGQQVVHYLMDHLGQYTSAVLGKGANKVHISPIPPRMTTVGVRPILLDVAGEEISYPDLSGRARVKKATTLRNLFSFGKR